MKVVLTRRLTDRAMEMLGESGHDVHVLERGRPVTREELTAAVEGADGLLCMLTDRVDGAIMEAGPLKVVSNLAVGVDNIDLETARGLGVVVTNTPGVLTDATADLAMALLLAVARRVPEGDSLVRSGAFVGWGPLLLVGGDLAGQTLGIVGAGRIGAAVARRARAFGMDVMIHSRSPRPDVGPSLPLDHLLAQSDFVSLHCPLTPETRHLLDRRRLSLMKPTAYLVNTARGPVVDEEALVEALAAGRIAGAALDVFEREPEVHPGLIGLQNVVLAPHTGSASHRTRDTMAVMAVEDLLAVVSGGAPRHPV